MTIPPIDPGAVSGVATEWQIPDVAPPPEATQGAGGAGFGDALAQQIQNLTDLQTRAADASQALANGTAPDAASVVIAVEKAQLAMQLAGQIRTRAAEAITDIFHTTV